MSITIHQAPSGYASAHGELWHVVESTNKAVVGFQYVFDIYKSGNLVTRVKNSPYGANQLGVLDVHNIVRASLNSENFPAFNVTALNNEVKLAADVFFTDYDVRYGEVSGGVTTENVASGTYRVYNNYHRAAWDKATSEIDDDKFLTNRPRVGTYYENEPIITSIYVGSEDRNRYIYDDPNQPYLASGTYTTPEKKNAAYTFGIIGVSGQIVFTYNEGGVTEYERDRITFNKKCSKYETHTLVFLNAYGAYDSFTFVHGKQMMTNEKKKFEQLRWKLSGNSMTESSSGIYNEAVKTYAGSYKETMSLTSDILSTAEYNWLSELINSPLVYYYSKDNQEYYPVQITDSNYEFKDDTINKADTLTVNIEFSISTNTQFR